MIFRFVVTSAKEASGLKVLKRNLKKGFVKVVPESLDDLWHLYNIVYEGDKVYARTTREIKPNEQYARPRRGQRISVFLGINVEKIAWEKLLGRLRVHGTICDAPENVPIGAHHTISISPNTLVKIIKNKWGRHHLERLERARKASEKPIIIIAIDDEGYAIATTAQYGVEVKTKEGIRLPGKLEPEERTAATNDYFRKALNDLRHVWTTTRNPVVIIGVGFIKKDFAKFLQDGTADLAKAVVDVKSVNNGGVAGIYEALRSGVLSKALKHLRVMQETEIIEQVLKRLGKGESNVTYGVDEVKKAAKLGAVKKLVLADTMLRESSDQKRLRMEELMKTVEHKGGAIIVVSTEHEAGTKLLALGGIAALLRFSVY